MPTSTDAQYSTTRKLSKVPPTPTVTDEQKRGVQLALPNNSNRLAEGGLRSAGEFKTASADSPVLTVITVVFNGADYIERTIKSVLEQTYSNIEYIVIDGASADGTTSIIKNFNDKIDYWVSEKDRGLYDAMNKAVSVASGEWLNFLNAGDVYVNSDAIENAMALAASEVDVVYSDHFRYNDTDGTTRKIICEAQRLYVLHQSMIYRRSLHNEHGPYLVKPGVIISDYLFFNLLDRNAFVKSPHPISNNLEGGISSDFSHVREKNAVDYLFGNITLAGIAWIAFRERFGRWLLKLMPRRKRRLD